MTVLFLWLRKKVCQFPNRCSHDWALQCGCLFQPLKHSPPCTRQCCCSAIGTGLCLLPVRAALVLLTAYIGTGALTISCQASAKWQDCSDPRDRTINEQPFPFYMNVPWQRWLPTPVIFQPTGDLAQKSMYTRPSVYTHTPQPHARHTAFSNTLKFHVTDGVRSHWWLSHTHLTKSSWPLDG